MKLNYKRTIFVGFAFFLICAFWQAYDNIVPKILTERFGISQTASGIVMALDNILALFMLPMFGVISDKCKSKMGRRTPFILFGTILAVTLLLSLSFVDNAQLKKIEAVTDIESTTVRETIYDYDYDGVIITPEGDKFVLAETTDEEDCRTFTKDEFLSIKTFDEKGKATDDYTNYVVSARQAYTAGIISLADINDTSITARSGTNGRSAGVISLALNFSNDITRGSSASDLTS